MKKRSLQQLALKKRTISSFSNSVKGGELVSSHSTARPLPTLVPTVTRPVTTETITRPTITVVPTITVTSSITERQD